MDCLEVYRTEIYTRFAEDEWIPAEPFVEAAIIDLDELLSDGDETVTPSVQLARYGVAAVAWNTVIHCIAYPKNLDLGSNQYIHPLDGVTYFNPREWIEIVITDMNGRPATHVHNFLANLICDITERGFNEADRTKTENLEQEGFLAANDEIVSAHLQELGW